MSTLRVLEAGFRSTIQDRGRFGHLRDAVPPAGPADPLAFEAAQRLVGNTAGDAAIEIVGPPFRFELDAPRIVAVVGRDVSLRGRGRLPDRTAVFVRAGEEIVVEGGERSRFSYLAVAGGIVVPPVLGARASYLPAALGPVPRALRTGDELSLGPAAVGPERAVVTLPDLLWHGRVRTMAGPHADSFPASARAAFLGGPFRVSERSDRMGVRLEGPALERDDGEILSCGVIAGAVQVPHGGAPIVLLADHQTTGGYPVIATVIAADIGTVAQAAPGEELSFHDVDRDRAVAALREERSRLDAIA